MYDLQVAKKIELRTTELCIADRREIIDNKDFWLLPFENYNVGPGPGTRA